MVCCAAKSLATARGGWEGGREGARDEGVRKRVETMHRAVLSE